MSPFVSLPTATTLSYNYKTMPSNIPPSSLGIPTASEGPSSDQPKPKFVISSSGHAASPDDILQSCHALLSHVTGLQKDAERELRDFEERIKERELAEKRRLAPGWLDSEARLLEPEKAAAAQQAGSTLAPEEQQPKPTTEAQAEIDAGAELDKAFGVMALKNDEMGGNVS